MAKSSSIQILLTFLLLGFTFGVKSPESSPSPAAVSPNVDSHSSHSPAPDSTSSSHAPASPPVGFSPPPPPSMIPSPAPSDSEPPSDSPPTFSTVPAPSPGSNDFARDSSAFKGRIGVDEEDRSSVGGGMSKGQKAGVVVGVVAAVCIVGLGGFVYKRRQDNVRRGQYSYAARREIL